ncbi:MAG: hypothetical protein IKO90_04810 [Bacteroidales bacterium]|nr:hypothetical protein [Bacteroidales bacterium]
MRKINGTIILSILALVISVAVAMLLFFEVEKTPAIDTSSYISIIVTLLGIIVTVVLGWQIYNVIDFKEKVKEIGTLKNDYEKLKSNIEESNLDIDIVANQSIAQEYVSKKFYGLAVISYMKALYSLMSKNDINMAMVKIDVIFEYLKLYSRVHFLRDSQFNVRESIEKLDSEIRFHKNYVFIKDRYEHFFKEMCEIQKWV